jgi:hypothetical protein
MVIGLFLGICIEWEHEVLATPRCQETCFQAKSTAYQKCRTISPRDHTARVSCFQQADKELDRCLKACPAPAGKSARLSSF